MDLKSFNISVQGASHKKRNKECQDASQSYLSNDFAIAVVCDGHGGNDYIRSAFGALKASEIAQKNIKEFVENVDACELKRHPEMMLNALERCIIAEWGDVVRTHWQENPVTEEEKKLLSEKAKKRYLDDKKVESAYGTTLIAIVLTKDYWFGIQIGDGKCVAVGVDSKIYQAIELDKKCFLNATTSLCDSDAIAHFHSCFSECLPAAIFIGSDGIDDCFRDDSQLFNFYRAMCFSYGTGDFNYANDELKDFLPRLSQKGSGDDVTVAGIIDMDVLPHTDIVKTFNREEEKLKKEKAEAAESIQNVRIGDDDERKTVEIDVRKETTDQIPIATETTRQEGTDYSESIVSVEYELEAYSREDYEKKKLSSQDSKENLIDKPIKAMSDFIGELLSVIPSFTKTDKKVDD